MSRLTYVATWRGFIFVAFVIDVFSQRRDSNLAKVNSRQTRSSRRSASGRKRERSSYSPRRPRAQYLPIRVVAARQSRMEPSVGGRRDFYDNVGPSVIGAFKSEVIRRRAPWRSNKEVEFAILEGAW